MPNRRAGVSVCCGLGCSLGLDAISLRPVRLGIERDADHLELVGMDSEELSESFDLAVERGAAVAELFHALEAAAEVPDHPEPDEVGGCGNRRRGLLVQVP